jgi:hypothetical protein
MRQDGADRGAGIPPFNQPRTCDMRQDGAETMLLGRTATISAANHIGTMFKYRSTAAPAPVVVPPPTLNTNRIFVCDCPVPKHITGTVWNCAARRNQPRIATPMRAGDGVSVAPAAGDSDPRPAGCQLRRTTCACTVDESTPHLHAGSIRCPWVTHHHLKGHKWFNGRRLHQAAWALTLC